MRAVLGTGALGGATERAVHMYNYTNRSVVGTKGANWGKVVRRE